MIITSIIFTFAPHDADKAETILRELRRRLVADGIRSLAQQRGGDTGIPI